MHSNVAFSQHPLPARGRIKRVINQSGNKWMIPLKSLENQEKLGRRYLQYAGIDPGYHPGRTAGHGYLGIVSGCAQSGDARRCGMGWGFDSLQNLSGNYLKPASEMWTL